MYTFEVVEKNVDHSAGRFEQELAEKEAKAFRRGCNSGLFLGFLMMVTLILVLNLIPTIHNLIVDPPVHMTLGDVVESIEVFLKDSFPPLLYEGKMRS